MNRYFLEMNRLEKNMDEILSLIQEEWMEINSVDKRETDKVDSNLDAWDVCFCIAIGYIAITITTEEQLSRYLENIHKSASGSVGEYDTLQKQLGRLLNHKGDYMDMIESPFKNRKGSNAYGIYHRLLWGHDIISTNCDNPFVLMIKQKGLSGILQAFQHLLADTMSKQGLPLPGSSYLDFEKENGSISNYLIHISEKLSMTSTGNKRAAQTIYSHLFTIRADDYVGNITIEAMSTAYFKTRGIQNEIRMTQFKLISYVIAFWGHAIIGAGRQDGVPYFNVTEALGMLKNFKRLYVSSWKEIKEICGLSEKAVKESRNILNDVEETQKAVKACIKNKEPIDDIVLSQNSVHSLIKYFNRKE